MASGAAAKDLTVWLRRMSAGESDAAEQVASAVYAELRRLASSALRGENRQHSLQPSLLVNEAFLQLLKGQPIDWQDRNHFFSLAARMMRRIIVDYFRGARAQKRPPRDLQLPAEEGLAFSEDRREEVLMVDEALDRLRAIDARAAQVVELRYFAGLSIEETAEVLKINARTVKRDWSMARFWLARYFAESGRGIIS
jgi:RNA polymerase sigma factor (TIGR02999 family)